ncbi:MAG: sulfite exporter TauE/SafE family protein [Acetobacteraceae bacterium]
MSGAAVSPWVVVITGAFLAAVLRGFTGFGFVMAAVPMLSLALPPIQVVPLALVLQIEISMLDLRQALRECDRPALAWLVPGMIAGTPIGVAALTLLPEAAARVVIGMLILVAVGVLGKGVRLPPRPSHLVTLGVGLIAGVTNGLAGMAGPAVVTYLLALPLSTVVVRATSIVFFVTTAAAALIPMSWHGLVGRGTLGWSLAALPALAAGLRLGRFGFQHSPAQWHRRVALVVLSLLGAGLILRGWLGR